MNPLDWKYWPHAIFAFLTACFLWVIKAYARKVDRMAEESATKAELTDSEQRISARLESTESRLNDSMTDLRREERHGYALLTKRIDEGFRGIHGRIDKLFVSNGDR